MNTGAKIGIAAAILGAVGVGVGVALSRRGSGGLGAARFPPKVGQRRSGGMTTKHYRSRKMSIDQRLALLQNLVYEGVHDPSLRKLALQLTNGCQARDGDCEARAIDTWMRDNIRYSGDIAPIKIGAKGPVEGIDLFQHPKRTVEFGGGDCLPQGTLLLTEGHRLVAIEDVDAGQKIWGRDAWTTVAAAPWFKGILPVDEISLNNGSSFKATGDHKVYVAHCAAHESRAEPCSCAMSAREVRRIHVSELVEGMVLVTPERIAFGSETQDPDRAWVEGLFLSDGWSDQESRFCISGQDGQPKEEQKHQVESICKRFGMSTRWHRKYLAVNDGDWAVRMQQMGGKAWLKRALSLDLDEGAAGALLRGIMADSGKNTRGNGRTFTTTSRELMIQTRILHKMFGLTCSERYIVDHGGLGEHPIWRLGVRDRDRSDGKAEKLLRVKSIEREVMHLPVWDISTEDHYVYLPEADVTVSNCDDHSTLAATLLALNGIPSKFRVTASKYGGGWSHIYVVAGLPKENPSKWVAVDTTLPGRFYGTEASFAMKRDFNALAFVKEAVT